MAAFPTFRLSSHSFLSFSHSFGPNSPSLSTQLLAIAVTAINAKEICYKPSRYSFYLCSLFTFPWLVEKILCNSPCPVCCWSSSTLNLECWNKNKKKVWFFWTMFFSWRDAIVSLSALKPPPFHSVWEPQVRFIVAFHSALNQPVSSEFLIDKSSRGLRAPTYSQITTHICLKWVDAAFLSLVLLFILICVIFLERVQFSIVFFSAELPDLTAIDEPRPWFSFTFWIFRSVSLTYFN